MSRRTRGRNAAQTRDRSHLARRAATRKTHRSPAVQGPSRKIRASRQAPWSPSQAARDESAARKHLDAWIAQLATALLGASVAMAGVTMGSGLTGLFGADTTSGSVIVSAMLIVLGVGMILPQRLAVWICTYVWRRLALCSRPAGTVPVALPATATDCRLLWMVLSGAALGAGILLALLPQQLRIVFALGRAADAHFVWSGPFWVGLQFVLVALACIPPLGVLGFTISCTHHLSGPHGTWSFVATPWLVAGAAFGFLAAATMEGAAQFARLIPLAAALPALAVALMGVAVTSPRWTVPSSETVRSPLPAASDDRPVAIRFGMILLSAMTCYVLTLLVQTRSANTVSLPWPFAAFLALGVGMRLGHRGLAGMPSVSIFSAAMLAAGAFIAGEACLMIPNGLFASFNGPIMRCLPLIPLGYALGYGQALLEQRESCAAAARASRLGRELILGAIAGPMLAPLSASALGRPKALLAASAVILAAACLLNIGNPVRFIRFPAWLANPASPHRSLTRTEKRPPRGVPPLARRGRVRS